uniref:Uncharacterized protein n=1 Tax=Alexandrium catenella TaxID=2925 RepID=A0A7S1S9J0_ALECA|mmetsp:Transcript_89143/g.236889  ORF Transcript_89143/g.236889 Transcript_89143/m.236889 type:complete len:332 (+) Transcript_89143:83-1078(+)
MGSARPALLLAALLAQQCLPTSAEVLEEECLPASAPGADGEEACVPSPARGTDLIQKARAASRALELRSGGGQNESELEELESTAERRGDYGGRRRRRTDFCLGAKDNRAGCWQKKPSSGAPWCTPDSGSTPCKCLSRDCHVDELQKSGVIGKCLERSVYIGHTSIRSRDRSQHAPARWAYGDDPEIFCLKMKKLDEWSSRHITRWDSDGPSYDTAGKWTCKLWKWGYKWANHGCRRKETYIGEECSEYQECRYNRASGDDYQTLCSFGRCIPAITKGLRRCQCSPVALKSGGGVNVCSDWPRGMQQATCDGHACFKWKGRRTCDMSQPEY